MQTLHDRPTHHAFSPVQTREAAVRPAYNAVEYGERARTDRLMHAIMAGMPRPFFRPEACAAADDPHQPARVYAPAAVRIVKDAAPGDAEIIAAGRTHTITAEAALHPGDRSDPAERA